MEKMYGICRNSFQSWIDLQENYANSIKIQPQSSITIIDQPQSVDYCTELKEIERKHHFLYRKHPIHSVVYAVSSSNSVKCMRPITSSKLQIVCHYRIMDRIYSIAPCFLIHDEMSAFHHANNAIRKDNS